MRVLLLVSEYVPHGGVERVVHHLVRMLQEDFAVEVLLTGADVTVPEELQGAHVYHLGDRRLRHLIIELRQRIVRFKPDIVVSFKDHSNVALILATRLARSPAGVVLCVHVPLLQPGEHRVGISGRMLPALARLSYRRAGAVVTISGHLERQLVEGLHLQPDLVHVVENPIIDESASPQSEPEHPWFHDRESPIIVAAGRLEAVKDYSTMLRGMATLVTRSPARLLILGDGSLRDELETQARQLGLQQHVHFLGAVPDARPWICNADLLVSTSRSEGVPTVIVEALWCRTPVVSTDSGDFVREVLRDERFGRVVPVGDPTALAEGMEAAMRQEVPPTAPANLRMRFGVSRALTQYREILSTVAGQSTNAR